MEITIVFTIVILLEYRPTSVKILQYSIVSHIAVNYSKYCLLLFTIYYSKYCYYSIL